MRHILEVDLFQVLAEPNRREILASLIDGDRSVGELVDVLPLSQPTVSKHLKILRSSGLVEVEADAQRRVYRLRADPLRDLDKWLEPYRSTWHRRLDALEAHLDTTEDL